MFICVLVGLYFLKRTEIYSNLEINKIYYNRRQVKRVDNNLLQIKSRMTTKN